MGEVAVSENLIQIKSIINYCLHQKIHLILQQNSNQNLHRILLQHLHLYLHHELKNMGEVTVSDILQV